MTVFNFPDTDGQPTDGTFQWTSPAGRVYIWDGNSWTSRGDGSGGGGGDANITVTDNLGSIEQPGQGDLAYHTVEARMYIYYEDDDSKQWVDASPGGDTIDNTPDSYVFMPTGGGDPKERVFYENEQVIDESYDITSGRNAMSAGPVTISNGVSVGVGAGHAWTVVGGVGQSIDIAGFWSRDPATTTLSPVNAGDGIDVTELSHFQGGLTIRDFDGSATNVYGISAVSGGLTVQRPAGNTSAAITVLGGDTPNISLNANGTALFGGFNTSSNSTKGIVLSNDNPDTCAVSVQAEGTSSSTAHAINVRYGTNVVWKVNYQGTASFSNAIFNLEPDNAANYVSTTNAEGETESVYNGPTLDVKALLLEFQSKIQTLEAAKSALETRLAAVEADHANMNMNSNDSNNNSGGSY